MARVLGLPGEPVMGALQLPPLLVLLETPLSVPAYNVLGMRGSIANAVTGKSAVRPVLEALQPPRRWCS